MKERDISSCVLHAPVCSYFERIIWREGEGVHELMIGALSSDSFGYLFE
jgi:hypothetical protein